MKLPTYEYHPNFLDDPQPVFWPVLHEAFEAGTQDISVPGRLSRLSCFMERRNRRRNNADLLRAAGAEKTVRFPPMDTTIAMVAGKVWDWLGRMPDTCAIGIYRDGKDFADWHADYEGILGPLVGDPWICIVSLGWARYLDFSPLPRLPGSEPEVCHSVKLEPGSLFIMRGETQRHFLHRLRADDRPEAGPRISLTFLYDAPEDRTNSPWTLLEGARGENDIPIAVCTGDATAVLEYWENLRTHGQIPPPRTQDGHSLFMLGPTLRQFFTIEEARRELGLSNFVEEDTITEGLFARAAGAMLQLPRRELLDLRALADTEIQLRAITDHEDTDG